MLVTTLLAMALAATTDASATDAKQASPDDKVVCQYTARTGTYLKQTKTCKTKANWKKYNIEQQAETDRFFQASSMDVGKLENH